MWTQPEAEWDETEQEWMHGIEKWRTSVLCPCGCGYPAVIAQDPGTEFRTTIPAPVRCHVRTALARAQKASEAAFPEALLWRADVREA